MNKKNTFRQLALHVIITASIFVISGATASPSAGEKPQTLTKIDGPPPAPDFRLEDQGGNFISLAELKGNVVIINFWATWCPPCREEMPSMQRAWEMLQSDKVKMLAINVGEDSDTIFTFTADYPVTFPLIMDKTASVTRDYGVRGLPATFIITPHGNIVYRVIGTREWDDPEVLAQIRALQE